eukprot:scaffold1654_cov340-Prasinococcus_capsulatus_cf.AAC.2
MTTFRTCASGCSSGRLSDSPLMRTTLAPALPVACAAAPQDDAASDDDDGNRGSSSRMAAASQPPSDQTQARTLSASTRCTVPR